MLILFVDSLTIFTRKPSQLVVLDGKIMTVNSPFHIKAHFSDPHLGTIRMGVGNGLLNILREIEPALILLTGDITQRVRADQFKAAKHNWVSGCDCSAW